MDQFEKEITAHRDQNGELSEVARAAILGGISGGESTEAAARRFGVSRQVIYDTIKGWEESKSLRPLDRNGTGSKD